MYELGEQSQSIPRYVPSDTAVEARYVDGWVESFALGILYMGK
jgi:hypothetical protein